MNLTGRVNRRTEVEKLLHQDHSDVYFDNQRLDNELNNKIEFMRKEKHRHELQIRIEISELRREITRISLQQTSNDDERLEDIARRPHTAPGLCTGIKPELTKSIKRVQSAWARTTKNNKIVSEKFSTQATSIERPDTPICTVPTLRNAQTLKRYKQISANCFKENNRFPSDWYIKCLPSSDAIIHSIRRTVKGKSVVAKFEFLSLLQEKEEMEMKFEQFSNVKLKTHDNKTNEDLKQASDENMNLVCETPVKPVVMSRKQLMEIANVESCVDRGSSRSIVRKQSIKDHNALDNRRIEMRVRTFCKTIEDFKEREMKFLKEREEARRREAQERLYLMAIDMVKLEQQLPEYDIKRYHKLPIMNT